MLNNHIITFIVAVVVSTYFEIKHNITITSSIAIPLEIPGPPSSVVAISLSGSEVEVFFTPPSGNIVGITEYTGNIYIDNFASYRDVYFIF